MILRPRARGPVVFLMVLVGCTPFARQPVIGPWDGGLAPPLEGADSRGRPMKLADYRGKVVLLSFWHGG